EAFQAAFDLLLLLLGFRFLQRGLQFLQPFVQILLPPREFLQPVDYRELLLALLVLGSLGLALGLVTIFRLLQIELIDLALVGVAAAAAFLVPIAASDLRFARL